MGKVFLLIGFPPAQVIFVSSAETHRGQSEFAVLDATDHKASMVMESR